MEAPDFNLGYPSKGGRIGPAWSAAWALLADGEWRTSREIVGEMIRLPDALQPKTAGALLRKAADVNLIERRHGSERGARVSYRRTLKDGS